MKTIDDIIDIMFDNAIKGCPTSVCQNCEKCDFCWIDTYKIAREYIKREGQI